MTNFLLNTYSSIVWQLYHLTRLFTQKRRGILLVTISTLAVIFVYKRTYASKVNKGAFPQLALEDETRACVHPELPLWSKEAREYLKDPAPIHCDKEKDWVYTRHGKFYISEEAQRNHGKITCSVWVIVNVNDSYMHLKPIDNVQNGTNLWSDAFSVLCRGSDGVEYKNTHPCIRPNSTVGRGENDSSDRFNIFIYGLDSVSRNMFKMLMPKTHAYFTNELGGMVLEGYNVVGDGTTHAVMSMLTGQVETDVPEVRRGKPGAKYVDEVTTFLWTRCQQKGYVTQWGEDMAHLGTFHYRLLGFKTQPVDHYMRPFQMFVPKTPNFRRSLCLGSRTRHAVFMDWLREGLETNRGRNFFTFGFFTEYSHDNNSPVRLTDNENVAFLKFMKDRGYLDNTIFILMSDHGMRIGSMRESEQGKLEERMPYFSFLFPKSFHQRFSQKIKAFKTNTERLTTPYDVHETLLEIIDESEAEKRRESVQYKGLSFFHEIPKYRTCISAGIPSHWCACMRPKPVKLDSTAVKTTVKHVVDFINDLLKPHTKLCHRVDLLEVLSANMFESNEDVLKFKKSADTDGYIPDLSDRMQSKVKHYQVTFRTSPRGALYEATVMRDSQSDILAANATHISRINKYGDAPNCIADKHPELRPYCVCMT